MLTMTKRLLIPTLAVLLAVLLPACDNLDVDPVGSVPTEQALGDFDILDGLVTSIYDRAQDNSHYGQDFIIFPDALADNITTSPFATGRVAPVVNNQIGTHLTRYGAFYSSILEANVVLEGIETVEVPGDSAAAVQTRALTEADALFLRGLNYFDLVRTKAYEPGQEVDGFNAGAIIRTEAVLTVEEAETFLPRSTNAEVYALVEEDFEAAADLYAASGRQGTFRGNEAAALGLLARAQLYQGKWAEAAATATEALAVSGGALAQGQDYVDAWQTGNPPGVLFQIRMQQGQDASTGAFSSLDGLLTPGNGGAFEALPTQDLLDAHEDGDVRLDIYETVTIDGTSFIYTTKFDGYQALFVDLVPVIRIAELYLTRAEARAEQGQNDLARADLNTLRSARGLGDVDASLSGQALIDAILQERRVELAIEGHRFFDLKRRGLDLPKPQVSSPDLEYENFRILSPLPQGEVDLNPELVQNPGY